MAGPTDPETGCPYSSNKRWVICFTNSIEEDEASNVTLDSVVDIFVKYQVNIVLVCYDLTQEEVRLGQHFVS